MSVSFSEIPADLRVPLFYAEMDNTAANLAGAAAGRALILGQRLSTGTVAAGVPTKIGSEGAAVTAFGRGSMLAAMAKAFFAQTLSVELWMIAVDDDGGGTEASGTLTVTGPATAAGTLHIYIGGRRVQVAVADGDVQNDIATAIDAAITADGDVQVTSGVAANVVTVTARHKGTLGDDIDLRLNHFGSAGGEELPAGVAVAVVAMSGGATDPTLTAAITAMGDEEYDYIVTPYTDATNLNALRTEMSDSTGRWAPLRKIYGHVFSAKRDTYVALGSWGNGRNDQHATVVGLLGSPTPIWEWASAWAARAGASLNLDAARPLQTLPLTGVLAPQRGTAGRFSITERNELLKDGIATFYVGRDDTVRMERSITTYQLNPGDQPDTSYLDVQTMATSWVVLRELEIAFTSEYPRHKLVNNGTRLAPGQAAVTPAIIKGRIVAKYADLERRGLVENAALFEQFLIVERNGTDPNRVDVLFPPDYANQFRVLALLNQFRVQYPAAS
jgi:phage tail sheath gpL-like